MEKIGPMLLILFLVMWLSVSFFSLIYKRRLKMLYPDLGASLHPGLLHKSIYMDLKSTRFLLSGEYRSLDNPEFVRFCDRFRGLVIMWFIVLGVTIVTTGVLLAIRLVS